MPLPARQAALLRILAQIDQEIAKIDSLLLEPESERAPHGMIEQLANLHYGRRLFEAKVADCVARGIAER